MEPSAPFMHVVLGCQGSSLGPRSATRPPACSSRLQQSLSRLFPFFAKILLFPLDCLQLQPSGGLVEVRPPLSSSGFNWKQLNPLFPQNPHSARANLSPN